MDKITPYRQPVVTAAGIFLGFMLNFTLSWMPTAFSKNYFRDTVIGISSMVCILLLIVVLFRVLRINYPQEKAHRYYRITLIMFLFAISIPFLSLVLIIVQRIVINAGGET